MTTPLITQYLKIKQQYQNSILLFQVGDFYEMLYDDAIQVSQLLNLALTKRSNDIPMSGFPINSADNFIYRIVENGLSVALCNQITLHEKLAHREVIKVITPGTIMNQNINSHYSNFLISIYKDSIACVENNTGDFFVWTSHDDIIDYIKTHKPSEILCYGEIYNLLLQKKFTVTYLDEISLKKSKSFLDITTKYYHLNLRDNELIAAGMISFYLYRTYNSRKLKILKKLNTDCTLQVNYNTRISLDINNKLAKYLNRTKTPHGSRLFHKIFLNPTQNISEIQSRHLKIKTFSSNNISHKLPDIEYIMNRIIYNCNHNEILRLAHGIIESIQYSKNQYNDLQQLCDQIINSFNSSNQLQDNVSLEIKKCSEEILKYKTEIVNLYSSYKIKHNTIIGYYIEMKSNIAPDKIFIRKQTLSKCTRYTTASLIELESTINTLLDDKNKLESEYIKSLIEQIKQYENNITDLANEIAEIDLWSSLSILFEQEKYVKPDITESNEFHIIEGRHPLINCINAITNSCNLTNDALWFITGANMGGKSIFLKQNAIFIYLAQIGFYIPATKATIGIVDALYARIGADDDLDNNNSTFMMEMLDIANITNNTTENSFIIIDELGRGTSFNEGRAISESVIQYLHNMKARTLISSHDFSLSLPRNIPKYYLHTDIINNKLRFSYRLNPGLSDLSYGIYTAKIAGVNTHVIEDAMSRLQLKLGDHN